MTQHNSNVAPVGQFDHVTTRWTEAGRFDNGEYNPSFSIWYCVCNEDCDKMKKQNGLTVYEPDDDIPHLPDDLPVALPYGFKIVDTKGGPIAVAASEADFRSSESRRLGVPPTELKERYLCVVVITGGQESFVCRVLPPNPECPGTCVKVYDPTGYWYCTCQEDA